MHALNLKIFLTVLFAFITVSHSLSAPIVKSKGQASVVYKALFGPKKEDKNAAISAAMANALTRYEATLSGARAELYRRAKMLNHFRDVNLVPDYTLVTDDIDKRKKRYTVTVEATINTDAIEQALRKLGPATPDRSKPVPAPTAGEKTYMTFVFVAREQASRTRFLKNEAEREFEEEEERGKEERNFEEDGSAAEKKLYKQKGTLKKYEKSETQKAPDRTYRDYSGIVVDAAVTKVLARANYEPVAAIHAGLNVKDFKEDFSKGDDPSPATQLAAVAKCREKGIRYLAVAYMGVGLPRVSDNTGMYEVDVDVTAKVSDMAGRFPVDAASVPGKKYKGEGRDEEGATLNAINKAAEESAKDLVDQLREKGIQP